MSDLGTELAGLSPQRRQLLELLLRREGGDSSRLPIVRVPRGEEPFPLSDGQLGLWLQDQASPGNPAYNMPAATRLRGELDRAALAAALDELVARHEALRTTIRLRDGAPVQHIAEPATAVLEVRHLAPGEAAGEERLARLCADEAARPFDLARGPLVRALLLCLGERDHVLVLTLHHIVGDRWSMEVLFRELAVCYRDALEGRSCSLPPLPIQYADFVLWQRSRLQGETLAAGLAWWREQLDGVPLLLDLPADRPRPPLPSGAGAQLLSRLPAGVAADLRSLCRSRGVTPFMVLLAAFQALLRRYTSRERLVVGAPVAGRERPETAGLVGYLVNTVVLSGDLSGDPSFDELLARTQASALAAFSHQEVPFSRLVEELRQSRDLRYHPVYQVMFALRDGAAPVRELAPGLAVHPLDVHTGASQVDLTLVAEVAPDGIETAWEYRSDLFEPTRVARLARHFAVLMEAALASADLRLADLPLLGEAERWQLIGEWNAALSPASLEGHVHELFEDWVDRAREAVAIDCGESQVTYAEVERRANRLARRLRGCGVGPEVAVGVCLERSPEMIVALLAVLKSGAVYVPLDPEHPPERLAFIVEDARLQVVITQESLAGTLPAGCLSLRLEHERGELARQDPARPEPWAYSRHLAYVIYTSGSTGRPKGVGVCHGAAAQHLAAWQREHALGPADRVYQFASSSFDASLEQILPTLYAGARLVVRGTKVPAPDQMVRDMEEKGLTVAYLPTAYWQQVVRAWTEREGSSGCLRLVNPGGDVMPPAAVRLYHRSPASAVQLLNGYGPTEAIITSAAHRVVPGSCDGDLDVRVPIGRPFGNRALYLLDRQGQPVPLGVPGELHIGGPMLARGYVRRPELTAARFVPDPFSGEAGGRLYRTGDIVRHRADGTLDFLGRNDHQVKVRGFRVELGEIEAALRRLEAVREAVVLAPELASGQRQLVGYVVPAAGIALTPGSISAQLHSLLPEHLVPSAFVVLDQLPKTASGKVDRQALPSPQSASPAAAGFAKPRNSVEELLVRLWTEALGRDDVGIHDNFFSLGGDSIISLRIIAQAHRAGLRLTPSLFFRSPTIAGLAAAKTGAPERAAEEHSCEPVPLTPIQRWFFELDLAEPHHWNQAVLFEVGQRLEARLLRRSVGHLLEHHDVLRNRFVRENDAWLQIGEAAGGEPPVIQVDLAALPEPQALETVGWIAAEVQASFELARNPLLRIALFEIGPARQSLLVTAHHLVMDGVSWRILLEDLESAYGQLSAGQPVELPPKTASFRRWAEHLMAMAGSAPLREQLGYWLAALRPGAPSSLPPSNPTGANTVADGDEVEITFSIDETRQFLQDAPHAGRVRVDDLLLTALAQSFAQVTGRSSLLVELEGHGREEIGEAPDVSRTLGWFTAKYPVLLDLGPLADSNAPGAALKRIKGCLSRVPGRGIGFGVLRYLGSPDTAAPLRDAAPPAVTFNYLGRFDESREGALPLRAVLGGAGPECGLRNRRPSPLEVVGLVLQGRLRVFWRYSRGLHRRATVEALAAGFAEALRALLEHSRAPEAGVWLPSDFPLTRIDPASLDRLRERMPTLVDLYPLSPVQQGMLFHSLCSPGSGVYVEQLVCELGGELDVVRFECAWRRVLDAHPVLRTAFLWQGLSEPLQAVCRVVPLPLVVQDWRGLNAVEQEERLCTLLAEDRAAGFDLAAAPLMRLFILRTAEEGWRFIWSNHHLLVDGWSEPLVLQEVFALYQALCEQRELQLEPRTPYRAYIEWLQRQDLGPVEEYWRRALRGFTRPTRLPSDPGADGTGNAEEELLLAPDTTAALYALLRRLGLTFNTLVQGGWALLLGYYGGEHDVVLGVTLSGRPGDLPGVEAMVGMFINTLPLRVELRPETPLAAWLGEVQERTAELLQVEHSQLVQVQGWSELPRGVPLFETIVVCMNQPRDFSWTTARHGGIRILDAHGIEQTNYPCTITGAFGERLLLQVNYRRDLLGLNRVRSILGHFEALFAAFLERPEITLQEVQNVLAEADRRCRAAEAERLRDMRTEAFRHARRRPATAVARAMEEVETTG